MAGFVRFDPDKWEPPVDGESPAKPAKAADPTDTSATFATLAGVPDDVRAGLGLLSSMPAPKSVQPNRWRGLIADAERFAVDWLQEALALGWSPLDLFGVAKPEADNGDGLVLLLDGRRVLAVTAGWASIELEGGGRLYVNRQHRRGERLLWAVGGRG